MTTTEMNSKTLEAIAAPIELHAETLRTSALLRSFFRGELDGPEDIPVEEAPLGNLIVRVLALLDDRDLLKMTMSEALPLLQNICIHMPEMRGILGMIVPETAGVMVEDEIMEKAEAARAEAAKSAKSLTMEDVVRDSDETEEASAPAPKSVPKKVAAPAGPRGPRGPRDPALQFGQNATLCLQALARKYQFGQTFDRKEILEAVREVHGKEWTNAHFSFLPKLVEAGLLATKPKEKNGKVYATHVVYTLSETAIERFG